MTLLEQYDTPAGIDDLVPGTPAETRTRFRQDWHDLVKDLNTPFGPDSGWYDPLGEDPAVVERKRSLSWIGFPRDSLVVRQRDNRPMAFAEAEGPGSPPRDLQPEYFEWFSTLRDGKIVKVVFTTESPEYWGLLAQTDPDSLLALYQELVSSQVTMADLFPGGGAYDPLNKWNTTDGIVHFVSDNPLNSLGAAMGLARGGAGNAAGALDNFVRVTPTTHAVDDYLTLEPGALVRNGFVLTAHDPVGLYIDGWDDTGWTKPDGTPVGNYWTIRRGTPDAVLRLEYEVPPDEGFTVSDILIGGRPVTHGGQLAENITSALPVVVARRLS